MIQRLFGAPTGGVHVSSCNNAPHWLGAPSFTMGGAELRAERL
jgi:hypothetical protein